MTREEVKSFFENANGRDVVIFDEDGNMFQKLPGYPRFNSGTGRVEVSQYFSLDPEYIRLEYGIQAGQQDIRFGSDPEFFFMKGGKVAPGVSSAIGLDHVAPDGFQSELHPVADTCRQIAGNKIGEALGEAYRRARHNDMWLDFSVGREIDDKTFLSIPASDRRFGCSPTNSPYENLKRPVGTRTRFRACGGHVHLGNSKLANLDESEQHKLVKLLDIICGNTCVLIDRDPANIKRRKLYGRAGEYRMKPYGIEYRVPSNFWLHGYVLWSMVSGLCRNATNIYMHAPKFADIVLDTINTSKVRKAINNNDIKLATEVFDEYCKLLEEHNVRLLGGIDKTNHAQARSFLLSPHAMSDASKGVEDWLEGEFENQDGFEEFISCNY